MANCNPLTNGHLYLMEQASMRVDVLHIFVLSETVRCTARTPGMIW